MSSIQLNRNSTKDPSGSLKHVTFSDTVEWADKSSSEKEESPTKKYTFWMLLLGVLAMVIVIWILIMFMSKSSEIKESSNSNSRVNGTKNRSSRRGNKQNFFDRPVLDGMMSDSGSIRPDRGINSRGGDPRGGSDPRGGGDPRGGRGDYRNGGGSHHRSSTSRRSSTRGNGSIQLVDPLPPNV